MTIPLNYDWTKDCDEWNSACFCPACAVTEDLVTGFKELIIKQRGPHLIQTQYGEQIAKAWTRIATAFEHPGIGCMDILWNENWLIVKEIERNVD